MECVANPIPLDTACVPGSDEYDSAIAELTGNYLTVVRSAEQVPFISLSDFVVLYVKYLLWLLCLYPAGALLIVNGVKWAICRWRRIEFHPWGRKVTAVVIAPFLAAHNGEVSALKFLTLRGVVRLLIYLRLNANLTAITDRIREDGINRFALAPKAAVSEGFWYRRRATLIQDLKLILRRKLGIAFWTSLIGAAGLYGLLKQVVDLVPKETMAHILVYVQPFPGLTAKLPRNALLFTAAAIVTYLLWIIATNFIVTRSVLNEANTYAVEKSALAKLNLKPAFEWPIDLLCVILLLLALGAPFIVSPAHEQQREVINPWLMLAIYTALPVYALIRRLIIGPQGSR